MKLAVIKTGGKQYKVSEGEKFKFEKLIAEVGDTVEFDQVFLTADGDNVKVGMPTTGTKVTGKVLVQSKRDKIRVVHYKPKTRNDKINGHRQPYTEVLIEKIA
jgi:large subunit ribosomal protein L21